MVDLHLHQVVAVEGQRHGITGTERDGAELRGDGALVADGVAEQGDGAAVGGGDAAFVDDAAGAVAGEGPASAVQAGVVDVQGRGDQTADVDLGALAEQDAVRVDQVHLAVGV
nr:hypothetical protein [Methylobacter tundripaludum]